MYGRHAEIILSAGPTPRTAGGPGWFATTSGAPHVDLNQAALHHPAGRAEASALLDHVRTADVPVLLGVSSTCAADVDDLLRTADFRRAASAEALFWSAGRPTVGSTPFDVRRVETAADHAGVLTVFGAVHDYDADLVAAMYGPRLLDRPDVDAWIAFDDRDPLSCVFVSRVEDTLAIFDMMTVPTHRRRGAGGAVLARALEGAASRGGKTSGTLFWSSPDGRPLYESLGFRVVDEVTAWTLRASEADLAAVGAG